ncbi:hypothetical protein [Streptomyces canarius]|uniref:Uncharacterized protein n=1 Tax=Streptomyces canarius TaxID=285453 RepID=A0ABQ3CNT0_9ACTN|nr:hypothetical protein GCM10010345_40060 [Streptomyces canarius]
MAGDGAGGTRGRWGAAEGRVREVACDESGSDGENPLGGNTDRAVLVWLPSADGPIHGRPHAHLTEKAFLVADRAVGLLPGDPADAVSLYRQGREVFGADARRTLLVSANALLRARPGGPNARTPGRTARRDGIALHGLRLVGSRDDTRVQIAGFLAEVPAASPATSRPARVTRS